MGVTWQEFWGMNPHIINCLIKGHEERIRQEMKQQDYLQYLWWGNYGRQAVYTAVEHCLAKKPKSKYIEKPIFFEEETKTNGYKESQEEVAVFEMKQRIELLRKQGLPESPM